jgi:hypothetical protein
LHPIYLNFPFCWCQRSLMTEQRKTNWPRWLIWLQALVFMQRLL